jgi:hypothetical protein
MNELLSSVGTIWSSLPPFAAALIVLVFGWLAAAAIRFLVSKFFLVIRFDKLSAKTGLSEFLRKGNAKYSPSRLVGVIAYWIALLAVFLSIARILDLGIYVAISGKLVQALPNLIAGALVGIVGSLIVAFLANVVETIALNASFSHARILSRAIKWLGIVIVLTVALEQAGLGKSIVEYIFQILLGSAAFGAALAFGLGCKDMARESLQRLIRNLREKERVSRGSDLEG